MGAFLLATVLLASTLVDARISKFPWHPQPAPWSPRLYPVPPAIYPAPRDNERLYKHPPYGYPLNYPPYYSYPPPHRYPLPKAAQKHGIKNFPPGQRPKFPLPYPFMFPHKKLPPPSYFRYPPPVSRPNFPPPYPFLVPQAKIPSPPSHFHYPSAKSRSVFLTYPFVAPYYKFPSPPPHSIYKAPFPRPYFSPPHPVISPSNHIPALPLHNNSPLPSLSRYSASVPSTTKHIKFPRSTNLQPKSPHPYPFMYSTLPRVNSPVFGPPPRLIYPQPKLPRQEDKIEMQVCPDVSEPVCAASCTLPMTTFRNLCMLRHFNLKNKADYRAVRSGPCHHITKKDLKERYYPEQPLRAR